MKPYTVKQEDINTEMYEVESETVPVSLLGSLLPNIHLQLSFLSFNACVHEGAQPHANKCGSMV